MAMGSNLYGEPYYAQGAGVAEALVMHTVSTTVTTTASISFITIINQILTVTVTTSASLLRQVQTTLSATISTTSTLSSLVLEALNIIRGYTKFLGPKRETVNLIPRRETEGILGLNSYTRRIKDED